MCPYALAIGAKYTYSIAHQYKLIENDTIEEGTLLNATNNNLDPFLYHLRKCGKDVFKKLDRSQIHSYWPLDEEDEIVDLDDEEIEDEDSIKTSYCNGNNEVFKISNQKCVICYERDGVYVFRQCGYQSICEQCYQNKGDFDILKCVVCTT